MAVDRRALRKYPGRKRVGRRRRVQACAIPAASVPVLLGLAVSYKQLVDADTLRSSFEYDPMEFLRVFAADRQARIRAVQAIFKLMGVDHSTQSRSLCGRTLTSPQPGSSLLMRGGRTVMLRRRPC